MVKCDNVRCSKRIFAHIMKEVFHRILRETTAKNEDDDEDRCRLQVGNSTTHGPSGNIHFITLLLSVSAVLTLAARAAQLLSRHDVLSSGSRTCSSKDAFVYFLMSPPSSFPRHHSENACLY